MMVMELIKKYKNNISIYYNIIYLVAPELIGRLLIHIIYNICNIVGIYCALRFGATAAEPPPR